MFGLMVGIMNKRKAFIFSTSTLLPPSQPRTLPHDHLSAAARCSCYSARTLPSCLTDERVPDALEQLKGHRFPPQQKRESARHSHRPRRSASNSLTMTWRVGVRAAVRCDADQLCRQRFVADRTLMRDGAAASVEPRPSRPLQICRHGRTFKTKNQFQLSNHAGSKRGVAVVILYESECHESSITQPIIVHADAAAQARTAGAAAAVSISDTALQLRQQRVPFDAAVQGAAGGVKSRNKEVPVERVKSIRQNGVYVRGRGAHDSRFMTPATTTQAQQQMSWCKRVRLMQCDERERVTASCSAATATDVPLPQAAALMP